MKVAVIGAAGGIGQALSLMLKNRLPKRSHLNLYDLAPMTPGVAVDLSHIPTDVEVIGYTGDDLAVALDDADVVMISAGVARKPGMDRADLFEINAKIIQGIIENIAQACPNACIGIITNPVNSMVPVAKQVLQAKGIYNKAKLFGVTTLDVTRAKTFVGQVKKIDPKPLRIPVIGGHSGVTILPLLSQLGIDFSEQEAKQLTEHIRDAGTEVVDAKAGGGSATLSMGQAAGAFCLKLVDGLLGKSGIDLCAYIDDGGQYAGFFALPIELGVNGIERIREVGPLSDYEASQLEQLLPILQAEITQAIQWTTANCCGDKKSI
ncbi:malate dehydrogenase [Celerinatantimonas yamalensis]|uniref:Malate dehydrogenase n=1 Tax=Celerinatantimonas yamalensis TaxID=559956 RepID=A0ABW9G577_9GAMM